MFELLARHSPLAPRPRHVTATTDLRWGLGMDSLGLVGLLADLEEERGIRFSLEDLVPSHFATAGDVVRLVQRRAAGEV